jgi:hypothetical protein
MKNETLGAIMFGFAAGMLFMDWLRTRSHKAVESVRRHFDDLDIPLPSRGEMPVVRYVAGHRAVP